MANIKDLKIRIKSIKGTHKITSAMKLVSAAKLARAQHSMMESRPYFYELKSMIHHIYAHHPQFAHPYLTHRETQRTAYVVISSDKGLCGGYNFQLVKAIKQHHKTELASSSNPRSKIKTLGKKGRDLLIKDFPLEHHFSFARLTPTEKELRMAMDHIVQPFMQGEVDTVYLAYNRFINTLTFAPTITPLLPLSLDQNLLRQVKEELPFDFKYDIDPHVLLNQLLPEYAFTQLQNALFEGFASEHGARMGAMDNASKNCKELIRSFTLDMNKLRQAAITTELIEVVSGAETLNA